MTPPAAGLGQGGFHVEVESCGGSIVVRAGGELDMASAPMLEAALTMAMTGGPTAVVADLSALIFVDATGTRVLITAGRRAGPDGYPLVLRSPRPPVLKVLRLTGIDRLMTIEQDRPDG